MLSHAERTQQMQGLDGNQLYLKGLQYLGEGEEFEATQWFNAAKLKGSADAVFNLGMMEYRSALATTDDDEYSDKIDEALNIIEEANEMGHKFAGIYASTILLNLVEEQRMEEEEDFIYECEPAGQPYVEEALVQLHKCAENGNPEAYYHIALLYENGYVENPANTFSLANYIKAAEGGIYGGYLGLYKLARTYGWDYVPIPKEEILTKLMDLSPYPPKS